MKAVQDERNYEAVFLLVSRGVTGITFTDRAALSFRSGVRRGKEIRIMVAPEKIDDITLNQLARDIAKKIEEQVEYPSQVKVVVIREFRGIDFA